MALGFRYSKSWKHSIEKTLHLETDSIDSLAACIHHVQKGGRIAILGDYIGYANHFPVGAMMEKSLTVRGGQVFVQKYWKQLLEIFIKGEVDPTFMLTHNMPLKEAAKAYELFDSKSDGAIKVVLKPGLMEL